MILNNTPTNEAILSNVGQIGEFRIRNSAKAFNILSSGLYANKIKAIIRELSCNAVDSHMAAGRADVPFVVHLPTAIEPYFSIRDFGTGLSHDQVTNIYTTYFESTKTNSNDFIGALGLGSKSPFSYTDNFTVTAIKDGRKGIYTAFINEQGVPSIALMGEEQTEEQPGVEVKFSVNDRFDFNKFVSEAQSVYRWFKLRPTITGPQFVVQEQTFDTKDIIPGVHCMADGNKNRSYAVMGNIAYPIEIPQADKTLGELSRLLECGLVMEFGIGELDFQASREGLSYIPQTVESIKKKLEALNGQLTIHIKNEADAMACNWTRSQFLNKKKQIHLWMSAVAQYAQDSGFPLVSTNFYQDISKIKVTKEELDAMNISIRAFYSTRGTNTMSTVKPDVERSYVQGTGQRIENEYWHFRVVESTYFIVNDTKVGALERTKHHWRNTQNKNYSENVYVLDKIDREKEMDIDAFYKALYNPPADQCKKASELKEKPRAVSTGGIAKNVKLLRLESRGGNRYRSASEDLVWRDAGNAKEYDTSKNYYYIPLSGFAPDMKTFVLYTPHQLMTGMMGTKLPQFNIALYGVRKGDLEHIKSQKNWINVEDYLMEELVKLKSKVPVAEVLSKLAKHQIFEYDYQKVVNGIDSNSPAKIFLDEFVGLPKFDNIHPLRNLMRMAKIETGVDVEALSIVYNKKLKNFSDRYPLIDCLNSYQAQPEQVAEYINLIDSIRK